MSSSQIACSQDSCASSSRRYASPWLLVKIERSSPITIMPGTRRTSWRFTNQTRRRGSKNWIRSWITPASLLMRKAGWNTTIAKFSDKVTATCHPKKNGIVGRNFQTLTLPDSKAVTLQQAI